MKSFKSLVLNLRFFIKPIERKLIRSPFLPYEGDFEADMARLEKTKSKPISENSPLPKKSSAFPERISSEIRVFLARKDNNLSEKSLRLLQKSIENSCNENERIESIFLFTFLLDDSWKKLKDYPNFTSFLKRFSLNSPFLNSLTAKTKESLKKELLKSTLSLRYYSQIKLSLKEFLYLIYSLEVASRPSTIESVLDLDLLITLINSIDYTKKDDFEKISQKETTYLFSVCRNYCFSDIEVKNQGFTNFFLDFLEKKVKSMSLQDIYYFLKEFNQIPVENTHFSRKEQFLPLIENIQKVVQQKLLMKNKLKDNESSLLKLPEFYFSLTKTFTKIAVISVTLLIELEKSFLEHSNNFNFKTLIIFFNFLTNSGVGLNVLEKIKELSKNDGFLKQIKASEQFYLVKFLLKITILEICELWNSINMLKETELNCSYFTKIELNDAKEKMKLFFESNLEIIALILQTIIDNNKKQPFSKEMNTNMIRIMDFLDYSQRSSILKQRGNFQNPFEEMRSGLQEAEIEFFKNDNNYYNQFNADINTILTKNNINFQNEKKLVYRYCDIYLPDENIVLELDGKFHFYSNNKNEIIVSNKTRNLFILMKESRMLEISIYDWEKKRDTQEMEKILLDRINFLKKNKDVLFLK